MGEKRYYTIDNYKVDGQLLYTADKERDYAVHMILFGFMYRYQSLSDDVTVIDNFFFCKEPDNLGMIIEALSPKQMRSIYTSTYYDSYRNCTIKHISEIPTLFPNLNIEFYKELEDFKNETEKQNSDVEQYLQYLHQGIMFNNSLKNYNFNLKMDYNRGNKIHKQLAQSIHNSKFFEQQLKAAEIKYHENKLKNEIENSKELERLATIPMEERQPSKISTFFRRLGRKFK